MFDNFINVTDDIQYKIDKFDKAVYSQIAKGLRDVQSILDGIGNIPTPYGFNVLCRIDHILGSYSRAGG